VFQLAHTRRDDFSSIKMKVYIHMYQVAMECTSRIS
jgi:hypothetical protein